MKKKWFYVVTVVTTIISSGVMAEYKRSIAFYNKTIYPLILTNIGASTGHNSPKSDGLCSQPKGATQTIQPNDATSTWIATENKNEEIRCRIKVELDTHKYICHQNKELTYEMYVSGRSGTNGTTLYGVQNGGNIYNCARLCYKAVNRDYDERTDVIIDALGKSDTCPDF